MRRATAHHAIRFGPLIISIHALREESDILATVGRLVIPISIHALREESDSISPHTSTKDTLFQSTLSVRRATWVRMPEEMTLRFQSTLSVRRATGRAPDRIRVRNISIHALREESDCTDGQHVSHCGTSILRTSSRVAGFEVKTRYSNHSTKK